ncbi:hypothetical protein ACHQM5_019918 [Ranunculus cassubicifolius]
MGNLNKIGIGLTVIFILSLVALFAELCYIFLRRRKQRKDESSDIETSSRSSSSTTKELLYLFCCGKGSSIELGTATTTIHPINDDDNVTEEQQDILAKWQQMYGPSRILFTIKEEEKEDLESEKSCSDRKSKCVTVSGLLDDEDRKEDDDKVVVMAVGVDIEGTETPYYTPSSSPIHELQRGAGNMKNSGGDGEYFVVEVEKLSPAVKRGGS